MGQYRHLLDSEIEYLVLELSGKDFSSKALIRCIYRPNLGIDYALLINVLRKIYVEYTDVIITGNILMEKHLLDSFESIGLFSVNLQTPTHFTNTCNTLFDLFLVNVPSKILLYDGSF